MLFGIINEDIMVDHAVTFKNRKWSQFKAWLDAHHDLSVQ